jgi:ABC-type transporter Mla subunit MlaD
MRPSTRERRTLLGYVGATLVCLAIAASWAQASTSNLGSTGSNPWSIAMDSAGNIYTPNIGVRCWIRVPFTNFIFCHYLSLS